MNAISISSQARTAALRKHNGARLVPWQRDSGGEKILLGLLVLATAVGIGYGFFCLVDLVQSCALFSAGAGRLIQ
jgi:hypothetical protein